MDFSYKKYFYTESMVIEIVSGFWPFPSTDLFKKYHKRLYRFVMIMPAMLVVSQAANIIVHLNELIDFLDGFHYAFGILIAGFKTCTLIVKREEYQKLFTSIFTDPIWLPRNEEERKIVEKSFRLALRLKYTFGYAVICTMTLLFLSDIEKYNYLPMGGWYPFDVTESPILEIMFIQQTVALFILGFAVITQELVVIGLTTFIAVQCDLICRRLENLEKDEEALIDIIKVHKKIVSFANEVEATIASTYCAQFLCMIICLAVLLFLSVQEGANFADMFIVRLYTFAVFFIIFLPCWFISNMTTKSENIPMAAYSCSWIGASTSFKKNLIYFIQVSQKPISIIMLGVFPISLSTAMWIVRTAFSYYTVLKTINNKN